MLGNGETDKPSSGQPPEVKAIGFKPLKGGPISALIAEQAGDC